MRSIRAAAMRWASARADGLAVPAADEDGFTLAAAAAEAVLGSAPETRLDSIALVGDLPPEAEWGLPELLGHPDLDVHRHRSGAAGLAAGLVQAAQEPVAGAATLVVGVDLPAPASDVPQGAGAVAFLLAEGPGLAPVGDVGRRHPVHRAPDASAWVAAGARAAQLTDASETGELVVVAKEAPPVLLRIWSKSYPAVVVVPSPAHRPGVGAAPTLAFAEGIRRLASDASGGSAGLVATISGETTRFLGVRRTGPVGWDGAGVPDPAGPGAPTVLLPESALDAVSEGAYIPRARYLESLEARWRFVGERCAACGTTTFPPRGRCRGCAATQGLARVALPRTGTVEAATVVAPGAQPSEFDPIVTATGAYGVAILRLAEDVRVTVAVAGPAHGPLPAGTTVRTELRRLYPMEGEWRYGRKAVPSGLPSTTPASS